MKKSSATLAAVAALSLAWVATEVSAQSPDEFFETRVRPVLAQKCYDCHATLRRGGLRVNSREALLAGGQSGPAIVPGDPDASLLMRVVRHEVTDLEMPLDADPLSAREIDGLAEWIRMDAPWPDVAAASAGEALEGGLSPSAQLFVDRVRPVLEQRCYSCHTDSERGGLRLDTRERVLQGGGRGPAIVPGNPEGSLLVAALRHDRDDLQMPRDADQLSDREIDGFIDWIRTGAEWADVAAPLVVERRAITAEDRAFWSFQPLSEPRVPAPSTEGWARTDIDRFVLAALEEKHLEPVGPADRRQLIRRATFDLIGLPPTPEEVQDFVNDTSEDAFAKVVDRLLASPHYGERWGRHWLDVTRYGEDDTRGLAEGGSGRERYPSAYVHRDWVVDAFNEDMPYDLFVKSQIAGDLLPEEQRADALGGLGFLGGGPWYYDLADPPVARADERHDRVDVTTRGFLGLTVGCARCHDHKYDPIGTHDYYALAGVFNNTNYHEYLLLEEDEAERYRKDKGFIETLQEGLGEYLSTESDQLARVLSLQASRYMMAAWQVTGPERIPVEVAAQRGRLDLETLERWIRFLAKEPKHYPFVTPWREMIAGGESEEEEAQGLADAFQRLLLEIVAEQDTLEERNRRIIAKGSPLEDVKSTPMPNGFESFFDQHQLELEAMDRERFNLYVDVFRTDLDNELVDTFFRQPGLLRFRGWSLERQLSRVAADHVASTRAEIEKLEEALPDVAFVMGVKDKDPADITDIGLHIRGNPNNLGERVPRAFPHVLAEPGTEPWTEVSGRLALAEAIADHPITSRVIVNRVWRWHMGTGIVDTPSNFGVAGERPTHPELLEYLAAGFVEGGRSIKKLHREIMLSAVYRLSTDAVPESEAADPANRYYWRANRQRLNAEAIRDALLVAGGNLDRKVGGPSLELGAEDNDRRTIYASVSRFQLDEYLQIFDFPNPNLTAERRFTTNVPLQSLFFLNSDFVRRQAEALVRRLAEEVASDSTEASSPDGGENEDAGTEPGGEEAGDDSIPESFDDRAMIAAAYPILYGRAVTEAEIEAGVDFLTEQRASHLEDELAKLAEEEEEEADAQGEVEAGREDAGVEPSAEVAGDQRANPGARGSVTATEPVPEAAAQSEAEVGPEEDEAGDTSVRAQRRASMRAWTQYARALFSAAEFRFID